MSKKLPSQTVIREKLRKVLSYEKAARKMFVKLTPGPQGEGLQGSGFSIHF